MNKKLLAAIAAAALVAAAVFVTLRSDEAQPEVAAATAAPSPAPESSRAMVSGAVGVPDRLEIASLRIDAPVASVGTLPNNAQEVPTALDETGWWRDGSQPGAQGNAVIVGHTASDDDGVFDRLVDIGEGDEIIVSGTKGSRAFDVVQTDVIPVDDFASVAADVYKTTGPSGLVLMTCGDWNGTEFETTVIVHARTAPTS
ncbi:class F sortase [Aeromicrobium sp. CF3.5]|uniref:class F sortase n=1 Tax=Aeromicrobium sp. CF3.5 TaxID=3373078 RepID=UPI003EE6C970